MSEVKYSSRDKRCATCKFFVGDRKLTVDQKNILIQKNITGACFGKHKGRTVKSSDTSFCWTKWDLLENYAIKPLAQEIQALVDSL